MFEAYLAAGKERRPRGRWRAHALAVGLHLVAGVALAVWRGPPRPAPAQPPARAPTVRVSTLRWAALRPVPPPGAARAPAAQPAAAEERTRVARRPQIPRTSPRPRPTAAPAVALPAPAPVPAAPAPPEAPPLPAAATSAAPAADPGTSTAGPSKPAGAGNGSTPAAPRFLPEPLANQQKIAGDAPEFPASLAREGAVYVIHARICVARDGRVDSVQLLRVAHPTLDANVTRAVKSWRYRPLTLPGAGNSNGQDAIPFCTLARFEFRTR